MLRRVVGVLPLLISALFTAAHAADVPVAAAPPSPAPSWSGFYVGVNAGESWGVGTDTVNFVPAGSAAFPIATNKTHPDGVIGGAQAGFNWQNGPGVFGLETDIQGSSQSDTATVIGSATCGVPCSVTETDKLTWFGTTRARFGYAWPNWMVYVTGGFAYGGIGTNGTEILFGGVVPSIGLASTTTTHAGWTAGGGIEGRLAGAWSWKIEYLHLDFGTVNYSLAEFAPLFPGNVTQSLRVTSELARAGLNYHFNFGSP